MRRQVVLALVLVAVNACRKKEGGVEGRPVVVGNVFYAVPTSTPTPDPIELLRGEAARRHLRWRVWCVYWARNSFQADAEHEEAPPGVHFIDEGRMDEWIVNGSGQREAALALYQAIQHAPTHPAKRWFVRPTPNSEYGESCPPDITSEDFVTPTPTPNRRVWVQRHRPRRLE